MPSVRKAGKVGNRTGEPIDDYSGEYYQSSLQFIEDYAFVNKVFVLGPALETSSQSCRQVEPYSGQSYKSDGTQRVVPDGWDHEHCYVCGWTIEPGDSYWENQGGIVLCDKCYDFVSKDPQHGKR